MHARLRIIITVMFATAFLVTAPALILFTSGYRYNWKRQRIQKTGSIRVETIPAGARASLDGIPQKKASPASYSRLLPEDYLVRLEKAGYLAWEKTLEVRSGETTFATGVVLYKDALPRLVLDRDVAYAAWSPDKTSAAFVADDGAWKELVALKSGAEPVLLARYASDAYKDATIEWSPAGDAILFAASEDGSSRILRFRLDAPSASLAIHEGFPKGKLVARWNDDGSQIVVASADGVFSTDAETGAVAPVRLEAGVEDALLRGKTAYVLRNGRGPDGSPMVALERLNGDATSAVAVFPAGDYRFLADDGRRLAVAEPEKKRVTIVDPANGGSLAFDATGAAWGAKDKRLLLWNDFEIFTADAADGSRSLITRLGTPIAGCAWSPGGDAVIFGTANGISAAELDDRDRRNVFYLIRFTNVGAFAVDPEKNVLRFVGSVGNQRGIYERDL
jgi:dipeptidyl aminopeptidase/acylaminoacyl peptidase